MNSPGDRSFSAEEERKKRKRTKRCASFRWLMLLPMGDASPNKEDNSSQKEPRIPPTQ